MKRSFEVTVFRRVSLLCRYLMVGVALVMEQGFVSNVVQAQSPPRERISFNADWQFNKDDPNGVAGRLSYGNIKDWATATGTELTKDPNLASRKRPSGNLGDDVAYTQPAFDDKGWRSVTLPHDWGIEGPFKQEYSGATGRLPWWGVAWYRKHFRVPAGDRGRQIYLDMDGAMAYANVWLNGQYVGGWPYGYASWRVDLTPYVKFDAVNVIAIRLDNPPESSRWYPGGGIYRNVWLVKTPPVHVAQWGVCVTTPGATKEVAHVNLRVTVDNRSRTGVDLTVRSAIYAIDPDGRKADKPAAASSLVGLQVAAEANATTTLTATVASPSLWTLQKPGLYTAVVSLEQAGEVVDTYETVFGIRSIQFDPEKGLLLNGERVTFQGVCDHHDIGALGTAINLRALQRQIELLKEMGCNAIRTSHNPPAPELLDLCDRMGIVVMDEAFDTWRRPKTRNDYGRLFDDWHEKDLRTLVRRDRNHPCVVLWSIGNEIAEQGMGEKGAATAAELSRIVHEEDPTRPTTSGCNNARPGSPFVAAIEAIGMNYQGSRPSQSQPYGNYPSFHQASPNVFLYGSETASTISSRGEYTFPVAAQPGAVSGGGRRGGPDVTPPGQDVANHQMSSYDLYYPGWATSPDTEFAAQDRFPFVGGEFVWTGWDYLGEPTPWGGRNDPSRSSYFGIIDLAGFKKDRFYLYQARWRPDLPMAHILPHWNWPERVGQVTPVHVYTSGDEAELFLNGKSLGKKTRGRYEYRLRWDDVTYEPGELKVVAYKNGKTWAQDAMKTAGPAAELLGQADRTTIAADGQDLSFVTITVADQDGLLVPRSSNRIRFSIEGPGQIVATDNGDATSFESFQSQERSAFNGLCLAIVRGKPGQAGTITVRARSDGIKDATIILRSQAGGTPKESSRASAEPIKTHPSNPHYFMYGGEPTILITSAEHYGAVINKDFDYVAYFDALQAHQLNYTRIYPGAMFEPVGKFMPGNTLGPKPDSLIVPWSRSDTPGYRLGGNRFDLDRWDPAYFNRLKDFLSQAAQRGIVVEVCFFNSQYADTWPLSPLYFENNAQGVGKCDWRDAQTLKHPDLVGREDDYVRKITQEVNLFDNVILEICDEPGHIGTGFELAGPWVSHLADVVRDTERDLPKKHLLGQEVDGPLGGPVDFAADPRFSVIVAQYIWGEDQGEMGGMKGLNYKYKDNKPIELNETCYYPIWYKGDKVADSRVEAWEFIVGGGAGFNQLNGLFTAENPTGRSPDNEQMLRALQSLKQFMDGFDFIRMSPDKDFLVSGVTSPEYHRAISEPGKQYALHIHHSSEKIDGAYTVVPGEYREDLVVNLPAGRYRADWVDPATGSILGSMDIAHEGGHRMLHAPTYKVDIALRVKSL